MERAWAGPEPSNLWGWASGTHHLSLKSLDPAKHSQDQLLCLHHKVDLRICFQALMALQASGNCRLKGGPVQATPTNPLTGQVMLVFIQDLAAPLLICNIE